MPNPSLLSQNLLALAENGRGDGTIYAWGTGATPDVANKTFDLTAGFTIMTDLGGDADSLFNGYKLVFLTSGNSYLITDWVAATDVATVFEDIISTDTGSWEIRRTLYSDDFNVAKPVRDAVNGRLHKKWIDKAANNAVQIFAALPNLIDDGGFEKNSLTDYWTTRGVGGAGAVAINAASPILGTYDCKFNRDGQPYVGLEQATKGPIRKGYTYGIIIKTGGDAGTVTDFRVSLEYVAGGTTLVPVTFTKINAGDDIATANIWKPAIPDANAWDEITFVVNEDLDTGACKLVLDHYDPTDVFIDEIYIWEIGPTPASGVGQPDTLIIGNHNMAGGFVAGSTLQAVKCQPDLTSRAAPDNTELIDLDASITVSGNSPIYSTFTAETGIYPVYWIVLNAISGKTFSAGEIWIGKRWDWDRPPRSVLTSYADEMVAQHVNALGGPAVGSLRSDKREYNDTVQLVTPAEAINWGNFKTKCGYGAPFWFIIPADAGMSQAQEVIFMRCPKPPKIPPDLPGYYRAYFIFEQAF